MDNFIAENMHFDFETKPSEPELVRSRREPDPISWKTYDPTWLVQLAREQLPHLEWLPTAFERCTQCRPESRTYIHFVDNTRPNQSGAEWQFETNLRLISKEHGNVIVDILTGERVGGIEFFEQF